VKTCPRCHTSLQDDAPMCVQCGVDLRESAVWRTLIFATALFLAVSAWLLST
jgi:RNA polymerase subunit RPABC4/transcription elongation factor Spt4